MADKRTPRNWYYWRPKLATASTHIALILTALIIAAPIIFALIKSTQSTAQINTYPPQFSIGRAAVENYTVAWERYNLGRLMANTFALRRWLLCTSTFASRD